MTRELIMSICEPCGIETIRNICALGDNVTQERLRRVWAVSVDEFTRLPDNDEGCDCDDCKELEEEEEEEEEEEDGWYEDEGDCDLCDYKGPLFKKGQIFRGGEMLCGKCKDLIDEDDTNIDEL
jgi:hypothetical protein